MNRSGQMWATALIYARILSVSAPELGPKGDGSA